jgi:two-component system chemotaxis sensor kinase CheA
MIATDSDTLNDSNKLRKKISDLSISLNRSTDLLQEQMMQIRKISLNRAFSKIPRLTRQTAQDLGKKVNYKTDGTDLLVDKNVARALSVSMTHLTRNAVDHGIETSEDRQRAGKPPVGTVQIKAKENAGIIFIEIEDDGRGSNIEKVKNKALQQKLITTEQAKLMADNEARELIFLPGFSTAEKISAVSGRGVGMDVVKTAIEEIHGKVKILPGTPSGSKILMEIPVPKTVMVEQSIIALSSEILVAIPLPAIARIVPREKVEITRLKERAVMQHEGKSIFLIRHTDLSNNSRQKIDFNNTNGVIVILRGKDRKIALWLDTILDQTEAVIRAFDQVMGEIPGFKGTTVLDDDRIAWVISPVEFVAQALNADGDNNQ